VDISLITSLYRAEAYLDDYHRHVAQIVAAMQMTGLTLELVLIANDPTVQELQQIHTLMKAFDNTSAVSVTVLEVSRETVYASWNRGFRVARGRCIGPWNVDDQRTAGALIEGHRRIRTGCALVYFPYTVVKYHTVWRTFAIKHRTHYQARPFDKAIFSHAMRGASFWLCARELFDRVGPFDDRFRIAGDFEWIRRALDISDFCPGEQMAGEFHLHGSNLSDTGNPLQVVENNIVHLRHGAWEWLVPAPPDLMHSCWDEWGQQDIILPEHVQMQLWGPDATERWDDWVHTRHSTYRRKWLSETWRAIPRFMINRTRLRPYLARLGIVKSAK